VGGFAFAVSPDTTSGDVLGEIGVKIAPRLMVFGDVGQFHNLQPSDIQPGVDNVTSALAAAQGLNVMGIGRVPAWYSIGGLRYEVATRSHVSPYLLGGIGFARLTPEAPFTFTSGTLPDIVAARCKSLRCRHRGAGRLEFPLAPSQRYVRALSRKSIAGWAQPVVP
jgi:hypothetical protein